MVSVVTQFFRLCYRASARTKLVNIIEIVLTKGCLKKLNPFLQGLRAFDLLVAPLVYLCAFQTLSTRMAFERLHSRGVRFCWYNGSREGDAISSIMAGNGPFWAVFSHFRKSPTKFISFVFICLYSLLWLVRLLSF